MSRPFASAVCVVAGAVLTTGCGRSAHLGAAGATDASLDGSDTDTAPPSVDAADDAPALLDGGGDESAVGTDGADGAAPTITWSISIDRTRPGRALPSTLLGQYDLAGSLWHYDQVPGLIDGMRSVGFPEWRVSVERWEGRSEMFPTLSDGTACTYPEPTAFVPSGWTDPDLLRARDWFVDDGQPVTTAMTQDDSRYALDYARSVIDVASAFGAAPFISIDAMPYALSAGRVPERTSCYWSYANQVTDAPPADPQVFASAVVGLVQRLVLGSQGQAGRPVTYLEFWNEPENFWDPALDPDGSIFRTTAQATLEGLAAFRASSGHSELRFGLAGFAQPSTAIQMLHVLDASNVPLDFVSFHSYNTDPIAIAHDVENVIAALATTANYRTAEAALTEWGPGFDIENNDESRLNPDLAYATSIDPALHAATVLARAAVAGLAHAHHVFFWDFFPFRIRGLLDHSLQPRPQYYAFAMLAATIAGGARVLPTGGASDTRIVLATLDSGGATHVLLVNRDTTNEVVGVTLDGALATPSRVRIYDDPAGTIREGQAAGSAVAVPAKAIALVDF